VRDEPVVTVTGPVAVTVTIGGINAPRHARTVPEILSRAQDALRADRAKRFGSFHAYQPNIEREAMRRESVHATDEIVAALNERRIALAFVHTLIDLSSRLGLKAVAEWVQDEAAAGLLTGWGCHYLQGALIGLANPERLRISRAPARTVSK
jgi:predicted signal transduction protein with EAL and GGDEF domain